MSREIIIHVGFDKVGSSSLQSFLTNEIFESNHIYVVGKRDGTIIDNYDDIQCYKNKIRDYSATDKYFVKNSDFKVLKSQFDSLFESGLIPIMSFEGWCRNPQLFDNSNFFNSLDLEPTVVFYIRPQVTWINSAWWQWFNWDKHYDTVAQYYNDRGRKDADWFQHIYDWSKISNVVVRCPKGDIVKDFYEVFSMNVSNFSRKTYNSNVSLSPELIKLLKKFPRFRKPHDSINDWILSNIFDFSEKSPWIIDKELGNSIISDFKESNIKLLGFLNKNQALNMKNNSQWWDFDRINRKYVDPNSLILNKNDKDKIIGQLLEYVLANYKLHN